MASESLEFALYSLRPNRSLGSKGRALWLALIFATALLVALAAAAIGAWLVLPFAGAEVALVWLAFHVLARHDGDYEVLSVDGQAFCWEQRRGNHLEQVKGNRQWASFVKRQNGQGPEIYLRYAGRQVAVGGWMTPEQREKLAIDLGQVFRCSAEAN